MRTSSVVSVLTVSVVAGCLVATPRAQRPRFDVLITNGRIVDGTGAPWYRGDVGIVGVRIAAIGSLGDATAATRIDASQLIVAPGFIDLLGQSEFNVLVDGRAASKIRQGVTTEITGEGTSIAPVNDRQIQEGAAFAFFLASCRTGARSPTTFTASSSDRTRPSTSARSSAPADCATTSSARTIVRRPPRSSIA